MSIDLSAGTGTGEGTDTLFKVEEAVGGAFSDTLTGDAGPNRLVGGGGDDDLFGMGG